VCPICCWFALRITIPLITPTGRSVSPPTDCPNGSRRSASTTNGVPADTTGTSVHPHHHRHLNNRTTTPGAGASHPTREAAPAYPHAPTHPTGRNPRDHPDTTRTQESPHPPPPNNPHPHEKGQPRQGGSPTPRPTPGGEPSYPAVSSRAYEPWRTGPAATAMITGPPSAN